MLHPLHPSPPPIRGHTTTLWRWPPAPTGAAASGAATNAKAKCIAASKTYNMVVQWGATSDIYTYLYFPAYVPGPAVLVSCTWLFVPL